MKKGQAAVEFLMTYGWAILVVLISVAALAYFGVLNPSQKLPETFFFVIGIGCNDFKVDSDSVTLYITNGGGKDFMNVSFSVIGEGPCSNDSSNIEELRDGETKVFVINCTEKPSSGSAFKREIRMNYIEKEGLSHSYIGNIQTKVED